ncbi:MAG TPA: CinA family protein [Caulobacter sp.]|nr:CinA family protein [Caulobacter sp.]
MSATEALAPALPPAIDRKALAVLKAACDQHLTIATAESCTGGLLASLLTDVPGCSHAFERGFVVYTEAAKSDLLKVPSDLIEEEGVVSQPVAAAMAKGALDASDADIALAVTGYAEAPPDDPDAVAGLVHFACATRDGHLTTRVEFYGDLGRARVRIACLDTGLDLLAEALGVTGSA